MSAVSVGRSVVVVVKSRINMQNKLAQQTSRAAHVCTTATGRLFIADKTSQGSAGS
jgi:hypothetical protein